VLDLDFQEMSKVPSDTEQRMRAAQRLEQARERLAALSPGGAHDHAIPVASAAVIEVRTGAMACPHCGGSYRVLEHTRPVPGARRVDVMCRRCSAPRALWFRIVDRVLN
jgi:hypothetical protein